MHVVMTGSPVDGMTLYGPFESVEDALKWSEANNPDDTWWIVPVKAPSEA